MKRTLLLVLTINALSAVIPFTALEAATKCESLSNLTLSNATITTAQTIEAGQFTAPARGDGQGPNFKDLPAFCRVTATVKPSPIMAASRSFLIGSAVRRVAGKV